MRPFENEFPVIPNHLMLLHGNVNDWQFSGFEKGEQSIIEYLMDMASGFFDHIYAVDMITPLQLVYSKKRNTPGEAKSSESGKSGNRNPNSDTANPDDFMENLPRIRSILASRESKNLVLFDYIEKLLPAEGLSENERMVMIHIQKWIQDPDIRRSRNLLIMICRNWSQLAGAVKTLPIEKIAVPKPDRETYERYLRYLVAYLGEVKHEQ